MKFFWQICGRSCFDARPPPSDVGMRYRAVKRLLCPGRLGEPTLPPFGDLPHSLFITTRRSLPICKELVKFGSIVV
jgi:hypothetical protein